jgi:arylsulfatase A-like enzyme
VGPTLLAALGLEIPPQFAGRDLLSADPMKPGELTEAFSSRDVVEPNSSVAVRTSEWKLYDGRLFNLTRDKRETEDVARPNADVARRLRNRLEAILAARRPPAKRAASPDAELLDRLRSLGYVE